MSKIFALAAFQSSLAFFVTGSSLAEDAWRVSKKQAECLVANVDVYLAVGETPTVIFLDTCPVYDPGGALDKLARNSLLPQPAQAKTTDSVVVFAPAEIRCLKKLGIDTTTEIVLIPKKPKC